jgi:hypothetical protein
LKNTGSLNFAFSFHNYMNYHNWFFSLEGEMLDFPVSLTNNFSLLLSPRVMVGMQPAGQEFQTNKPAFFGLVGCRVDFDAKVLGVFQPWLEVAAKTDGWVAGNEYLDKNISFQAGFALNF